MKATKKKLATADATALLTTLQVRFEKNVSRHKGIEWKDVLQKLQANPDKLWSLNEMENTGGEPDIIGFDKNTSAYIFVDCSAESPAGRRSLCYDREALDARKEHKPVSSAMDVATEMGVEILTEENYRALQKLGKFDQKTSSWLLTPDAIRKKGGSIFGDYRYGQVFVYHNGAQSYYAGRAFRGMLFV